MSSWYDYAFGAPAPPGPPPHTQHLGDVLSDPLPFLPRTACEANELVSDYLGDLMVRAQTEYYPEIEAAALAASYTTLAISGAALLLGRVLGGERWILSVLYLLASLVGAAGMSKE